MTALRDELRQLEAAFAEGALTRDTFERRKSELFDAIPEVTELPPERPHSAISPDAWIWVAGAGAALAVFLALSWLVGDVFLAITCMVTLAAALAVRVFVTLDR